MAHATVQIRQRGTVTLPAKLREKYRLGDGDVLTVHDLGGSILLTPRLSLVGKLAAEIERHRKAAGLDLEDLLPPASPRRAKRAPPRKRP